MENGFLSESQRAELERVSRSTQKAAVLRRATSILAVDAGERAAVVAERLGIHRSTVYDWVARYRDKSRPSDVEQRLTDRRRTGRKPRLRLAAMKVLGDLLTKKPEQYGYRRTSWTAGLLHRHLRVEHNLKMSEATVRRTIHALGYRWKRPRYVLSRRSPTWRQAQGGSNAA